jgi:hypothetical protein
MHAALQKTSADRSRDIFCQKGNKKERKKGALAQAKHRLLSKICVRTFFFNIGKE